MKRHWMRFHVGDYRNDTSHLRAAGHGAYLLLIMHYWSTGGLPDDDRQLATIACMTDRECKEWRPTLQKFFHDGWRHKRVDAEISDAQTRYEKRAEAGKKGGKSTKDSKQCLSNASKNEQQCEVNLQPTTYNQLEKESVLGGRKPTRPERDEKFEEFKRAYPRRKGANPWKPARALFDRAILAGINADQIISALRSGIGYDREKVNTEYIPQAVKWLRDERWKDLLATPAINDRPAYLTPPPGCQSLEEIRAAYGVPNGQSGTEVRIDAGMGKDRPH